MKQRIDHFGEGHAESNSEPKWWCPEFQRKYGRALTTDEMVELEDDISDEDRDRFFELLHGIQNYGR